MAAQRRVCLQIAMDDSLPKLVVQEIGLRQTLLNLISVAIHRTSDGRVTISARPLPMEVEIRVRGTGPDPGVRATSSDASNNASNDDATNLDLARKLADFCGGRLAVSDERGSFDAVLVLPALEQWPALVIDDNVDTLNLLRRYVAGTRYRLVTTQDPEQAVQMAEQFSPKVIVLDVMMPRVDGWKLLASLRHHPRTAHIPIVVCTILAQRELALSLGANSFLRKPVTRQAFLKTLDRQTSPMGIGYN
jgi:CheY-like chemotaxis protein